MVGDPVAVRRSAHPAPPTTPQGGWGGDGSRPLGPGVAVGQWQTAGGPAVRTQEPWLADPADPRYHGLPFSDETPRYLPTTVHDTEIARLVLGVLRRSGNWHVHRVGSAVYAHGANGARWIIGLRTGDADPAWWARLLTLAHTAAPAVPDWRSPGTSGPTSARP